MKATIFLHASFWPLITIQCLLSALCALGVFYILVRFLKVNLACAIAMCLLCSIDPLQLYYERSVMTECVSLTLFMLYLVAGLAYLEGKGVSYLVAANLLSALLISFRLSFLPVVFCLAIALPALKRVFEDDSRNS